MSVCGPSCSIWQCKRCRSALLPAAHAALRTAALQGHRHCGAPSERAADAAAPLFVLGNAAHTSLLYLVNKIVNRAPDDRIRLVILPATEENLYREALRQHRAAGTTAPATAAAAPSDAA